MTDTSDLKSSSVTTLACLLTGAPGDEAALAEALAWRDATGSRLTVMVGLPTPRYVAFPDGGAWS